jgi:hypothetical protein
LLEALHQDNIIVITHQPGYLLWGNLRGCRLDNDRLLRSHYRRCLAAGFYVELAVLARLEVYLLGMLDSGYTVAPGLEFSSQPGQQMGLPDPDLPTIDTEVS